MRLLVIVVSVGILMTGCDPSAQVKRKASEKERIASRACGEILQTRKFESAKRAQIWNDAVDKIGVNGSYWNPLSDKTIELTIMVKGSIFGAKQYCRELLLKGEAWRSALQ